MVKRLFRPLGRRLQRFARVRINNFARITNTASRSAVAPVWEEATDEPLVWQTPVGAAAPQPEPEPEIEPDFEPEADSGPRRTPPDLAMILELHEQKRREEGIQEPPSPFRPAGTSAPTVPGAPAQRRPAAPIQRTESQPSTPPPRPVAQPRRGRVISETTPTGSETELPPIDEPDEEEAPEWEAELENDPPPDQPDLAQALISAGMMPAPIQRDPDTPEYTPRPPRRHRARIEYKSTTALNPEAPVQRQPDSTPAPTEPHPAAPPSPEAARPEVAPPQATTPPTTPLQRQPQQSAPIIPPKSSQSGALTPAPGTNEADLLDILGLPPDTPVIGLNPAAAQPAIPSATATPSAGQPSTVSRAPVDKSSPAVNRPDSPPIDSVTNQPAVTPSATPQSTPVAPIQRQPATPNAPADYSDDVTYPNAVENDVDEAVTPDPIESSAVYSDADDDDHFPTDGPSESAPPPVQRRSQPATNRPAEPPLAQRSAPPAGQPATVSRAPVDEPSPAPTAPVESPESASVQRQAITPPNPSAPPTSDFSASPPPALPSAEPGQSDLIDDFDEYGDTRPMEPLSDVEPLSTPTPPGYHVETPPISRSAPAGQINRAGPIDDNPTGKLGASAPPPTGFPQANEGKAGALSPATSTSSSAPPPMGGKLGGKLGNDVVPGKISAESTPNSPDAPAAEGQPATGSPNMPQEALDLLETFGFDTDPFGGDPNSTETAATSDGQPATETTTSNASPATGGDEDGGESGEAANSEDAVQAGGVNVDKLARDVFNVLRDRLRIENERRSTR